MFPMVSSIDVRSLIKAWFSVYPGFFRSGVKESFKALLTSPRLEELVSNGFKFPVFLPILVWEKYLINIPEYFTLQGRTH